MSFDVSIAGTSIPTDVTAFKSFRDDLNLAFGLDATLRLLLNDTLAQVPSDKATTSVTYKSGAQSWTPSGGPVTFGLQGGFSGAMQILTSGSLLDYTDGLETQTQKSITVPANTAYIKLTLHFNLSGNATANWSSGPYGVKSSLDASATYAITFCKAFALTTKVIDAVGAVFAGFVLPFHKDTLKQMDAGDLLQYAFDGNLHLAFGAYAGFDKVLYAGQSSADVLQVLHSPLATLSASAKPEVKADVALDFSYQYATSFEALLSRMDGSVRLHLFKSSKSTTTTTLSAGLKFDGNVTASIKGHQDTLAASLVAAAGGAGTPAGTVLQAGLGAASGEVAKYIAEANDKLAAWLNKANGLQVNLQVAIEATRSRTILAGYTFDLNDPAFQQAWDAAVAGDFLAAFQTKAVALDVGSGLEQEYQQKTSCALNVFNLWNWSSWSQFSSTMSLVYAGAGRFHLSANVGRKTETDVAGTMRSIEFYFAAEADVSTTGTLTSLDVNLHINLTATGQPKEAARIAMLLGALHAGTAADALSHSMMGFASTANATLQLLATVPMAAMMNINRDVPGTGSFVFDSANWTAFAAAADDLNAWPLRSMSTVSTQNLMYLKSFNAWEDLNQTCTGSDHPDRTQFGNRSGWPDDFPQADSGSKALLGYSMFADQAFMNFCAALHDLVRAADVGATGTTWKAFMEGLSAAVKNGSGVDFIRPTALAILRVCLTPAATLTGPVPATIPTQHFTVTLDL